MVCYWYLVPAFDNLKFYSGDGATESRLKKYLASGDIMRKESLLHASLPCSPLKCDSNDEEFYCVQSTGAIVTLTSSVELIYFYCSRLPSDWLVNTSSNLYFLICHVCCSRSEEHTSELSHHEQSRMPSYA